MFCLATVSWSYSFVSDFDKKSMKNQKSWKFDICYDIKGGKRLMYFVVGLVSVGILGRDSETHSK